MNFQDSNIDNKLIQPIRFFRNNYGDAIDKRSYNYFEYSKNNVAHQIVKVPTLALIKFQAIFPAYYYSISELKIYCPDRTTLLFDIKNKLTDITDAVLEPYIDSNGNIVTHFVYRPIHGFTSTCPTGYGIIKITATNGTTPITWESDVIELFSFAITNPGNNGYDYSTETEQLDNELNISTT